MNWAIGQGSSGGRQARNSLGKCRRSTLTSSLLQSQKLVSKSLSSSGVSRSDEKVVKGDSATLADCPERLRLAVFMAAFLKEHYEFG
jgi:hypothetical protein